MKVHNFTVDSSQRDTNLYTYSNNYVISLENPIYDVSAIKLVSARIPTPFSPAPKSIALRLSSGSDEFNQTVYTSTPHYTGHILLDPTYPNQVTFNGHNDPLIHRFHSGSQKTIKELRVEFLHLSAGNLIPYQFGSGSAADHILKFEITCSTDKLENLEKMEIPTPPTSKKTPININEVVNSYKWKKELIYIGLIIFIGLMMILLMN